jgi:hypothetical protein
VKQASAPPTTLVIMARIPRPGQTKTRLIPLLGPAGAAAFQRACLEDLAERLADATLARKIVAWSDPFEEGEARPDIPGVFEHRIQRGGDLGQRMVHLYREFGGAVIFVGSDAPTLPRGSVVEAVALLQSARAVFQPAEDGGYVLGGHSCDPEPLFRDVPWGEEGVLGRILASAATLGMPVGLLEPWYDVDSPKDLRALVRRLPELEGGPCFPTRTARWVRSALPRSTFP